MSNKSSRTHVWRICIVVAVAFIVMLIVQRFLRPDDFGDIGHYRAGALEDAMAKAPLYQGEAVCGECHDDIYQVHEKDVHFGVECEDCHGPGQAHVAYYLEGDERIDEASATMPREYTLEGCLFCHRKLDARPRNFPQIDPQEHYAFLHVEQQDTRCIECHSPHEPLFLLTRVEDARIHPVIQECDSCHETQPEGDPRQVAGHQVIFVCGDCHPTIVSDFEQHDHSFLRCTSCHLYHPENESAGRIYKNGNKRFCLLCHEEKPFKDPEYPPQINSVEHIEELGTLLDEDEQGVLDDARACLACHFENIHDPQVIKEWREARSHE